jgi:hypothetical protein
VLLGTGERYVCTAHVSSCERVGCDKRITACSRSRAIIVHPEQDFVDAVRESEGFQRALHLAGDASETSPEIVPRK